MKTSTRLPILLALLLAAVPCGTASAMVVFAQTGSETSTGNGGSASDSASDFQIADDVTLATAATVRSVKWWGAYGPFDQTPVAPYTFQLIFYGDSGGLPDLNNVISSTAVVFAALSPVTEIIPAFGGDKIYYEFRANVIPTTIPAGTKVWFSVLGNTSNDPNDDFLIRIDDMGNSASRNNSSSPFIASTNQRMLFALYDTPVRPITTIYADDFSGTGSLHSSVPDLRPGTETWTASTDFQANGTTASVNSTIEDDSAFLPFTPLSGKIYTLSATLLQPSGGYSTSSTNAWAGIGFSTADSTGSFPVSPNNPSPWMVLRRTGEIRTYSGLGITGSVNEATYTGLRILRIVLDTSAPNWTAEWFVGLRSLRKHTFTTNPAITHIGLAREDGVALDFNDFRLTSEDGDVVPRIVSFASAGGSLWNLELVADPGMPYEFRSSTSLPFAPGVVIENLSKAFPADPGSIGGPTQNFVTTDGNGRARVRLHLADQPRNFVQAVALP